MELHVITACLVLLAFEPAGKFWRRAGNWLERWRIHKAHQKQIRDDLGLA